MAIRLIFKYNSHGNSEHISNVLEKEISCVTSDRRIRKGKSTIIKVLHLYSENTKYSLKTFKSTEVND